MLQPLILASEDVYKRQQYNSEDIRFPDQTIVTSHLVEEMEKSYMDYAMSVSYTHLDVYKRQRLT